ncbi:hypothetical protein SAMN04487848_2469, partial [Microbacterium sp. ru370.1]
PCGRVGHRRTSFNEMATQRWVAISHLRAQFPGLNARLTVPVRLPAAGSACRRFFVCARILHRGAWRTRSSGLVRRTRYRRGGVHILVGPMASIAGADVGESVFLATVTGSTAGTRFSPGTSSGSTARRPTSWCSSPSGAAQPLSAYRSPRPRNRSPDQAISSRRRVRRGRGRRCADPRESRRIVVVRSAQPVFCRPAATPLTESSRSRWCSASGVGFSASASRRARSARSCRSDNAST